VFRCLLKVAAISAGKLSTPKVVHGLVIIGRAPLAGNGLIKAVGRASIKRVSPQPFDIPRYRQALAISTPLARIRRPATSMATRKGSREIVK